MSSVINLIIPEKLRLRYQKLSLLTGKTAQSLMQEALEEYAQRLAKRLIVMKEARASYDEYRRTGLHITADECLDWLGTWGSEKEVAPPQKSAPVKHFLSRWLAPWEHGRQNQEVIHFLSKDNGRNSSR